MTERLLSPPQLSQRHGPAGSFFIQRQSIVWPGDGVVRWVRFGRSSTPDVAEVSASALRLGRSSDKEMHLVARHGSRCARQKYGYRGGTSGTPVKLEFQLDLSSPPTA